MFDCTAAASVGPASGPASARWVASDQYLQLCLQVGQLASLRLLDVHANPRLRQLPRGLLLPPLQHQLRLVVDGDKVRSRPPSAPHQPGAGGWCSELVYRFGERLVTKSCAPQGVCC